MSAYPDGPPVYSESPPGYDAAIRFTGDQNLVPGQRGRMPPPPTVHQTVVVIQPLVTSMNGTIRFCGESAARVVCQHCGAEVTTTTEYVVGSATWLLAGVLCILGLSAGCCLFPFCLDCAKDVVHTCPRCENQVGVYRR